MEKNVMSERSSLIPVMNVVKKSVFINGEQQIFDSILLTQKLNDSQHFELIQKETTDKELWFKSPEKRNEIIGSSVLIRLEYPKGLFK